MSDPQCQTVFSQPHPLSETASNLVSHIPKLLQRLRDLENEETKLDARARQLLELPPKAGDNPTIPSRPAISTPLSKLRIRATKGTADKSAPGTPPHIDPRNIETPVKTFLLMESLALAMSVRSKRRGRVFLAGDSTEFGERR